MLSYSMERIELNSEEIEILCEVLQHNLAEIDLEIFRTDTREFKERLKHRRAALERILTRLSQARVPA